MFWLSFPSLLHSNAYIFHYHQPLKLGNDCSIIFISLTHKSHSLKITSLTPSHSLNSSSTSFIFNIGSFNKWVKPIINSLNNYLNLSRTLIAPYNTEAREEEENQRKREEKRYLWKSRRYWNRRATMVELLIDTYFVASCLNYWRFCFILHYSPCPRLNFTLKHAYPDQFRT